MIWGAYAWYYNDRITGIRYWAYAYEISATAFAARVSTQTSRHLGAGDISYAKQQ